MSRRLIVALFVALFKIGARGDGPWYRFAGAMGHFMMRICWLLLWLCAVATSVFAQSGDGRPLGQNTSVATDEPVANPGRPTVATPATLTPVGYFQFETGVLGAWNSPEFSSQFNFNEVIKFSVSRWVELLAAAVPYEHAVSKGQIVNGTGGLGLGVQGVIHHGEGVNPTVALGYFGAVVNGNAPDLDIGSFKNSALLLVSNDMKGFHSDLNILFNEVEQGGVRRAQFGQALSVWHSLGGAFGLSGEIWHFTQPFLHSNCVGTLWGVNYNAKKNLVLDVAFNYGFTSTSTKWAALAGFTYVLPKRIRMQ
jgi:hypothetical protein